MCRPSEQPVPNAWLWQLCGAFELSADPDSTRLSLVDASAAARGLAPALRSGLAGAGDAIGEADNPAARGATSPAGATFAAAETIRCRSVRACERASGAKGESPAAPAIISVG